MLDTLFKFPVIMMDSENEERKELNKDLLGSSENDEIDIIIGEVECPYWDFISVSDRWIPNQTSFQNALNGKFDACGVIFASSGSYTVPWTKDKFKKEFQKFLNKMPKSETRVISLTSSTKDEPEE